MKLTRNLILFSALIFTYPLFAIAAETEESCETKWVIDSVNLISNQTTRPDFDGMLSKWLSYEPVCGKTIPYIAHLALIHILQNDFESAKTILVSADTKSSSFGYLIESTKIQLQIQEALASKKEISRADYSRFENDYLNILKKYPNWLNGYALLGGMQTELGKHKEAIVNLQKAKNERTYDQYYLYRNLTISNAALNENKAALDAADKAYVLNKDIFTDPEFVIAYANVSTKEGYLADTKNALKVLLAKHPEVENDPEFVQAVNNFKVALGKQTQ